MIGEMSLGKFSNKINGHLPGGNKRKTSVAISFLLNSQIVLLLDDPSSRMEHGARKFIWPIINKISTKGKNLLLL